MPTCHSGSTAWMPQSCRYNCMVAAFMPKDPLLLVLERPKSVFVPTRCPAAGDRPGPEGTGGTVGQLRVERRRGIEQGGSGGSGGRAMRGREPGWVRRLRGGGRGGGLARCR